MEVISWMSKWLRLSEYVCGNWEIHKTTTTYYINILI